MLLFDAWPVWAIAAAIFLLRIIDVSLGTLRTITVVQGYLAGSMLLGFFEILIWLTALSQVVLRLHEDPVLTLAYAGGFAVGSACGIVLDRRLSVGSCVVRMVTGEDPGRLTDRLRGLGQVVTTWSGLGRDGPRTLMLTTCPRRNLETVLDASCEIDPALFYTVERFTQADHGPAVHHPTGWRAVLKKK